MIKESKLSKTSIISLFLIIFLVLILIVFSVTSISLNLSKRNLIAEYKQSASNQLKIQKRLMLSHLSSIESDLKFLPRLNEVLRFKEIENETDRADIEVEFLEFIKSRNIYDQLRYIDKQGIELARINYNNGNPAVTPGSQLQDKSSRYYFRESIIMPEGKIYVSPFDLNVEHGEIEQPLKPMIRFGTPVFSSSGEARGIVILNFLGQTIINDLDEATGTHSGTYSLLNKDGYWLYNNNPAEEWGFMYPEKREIKLPVKDPELWKRILENENMQLMTDENLYTVVKIQLFNNEPETICSDCLILINTISANEMGISRNQQWGKLIRILLISSVFITILSLSLSITIIQRRNYSKALQELALYDQLTGLPNRKLLGERETNTIHDAARYGYMHAVMFIDLDGFKSVNDTMGHNAGDLVLKEAAEILKRCIRKTDTAARFGGDEFIILISRIKSSEDCKIIAEKIITEISREFLISGKKVNIGASIGIAAVKPDAEADFQKILLAADTVMYDVKKSGKNNYKIVTI